MADTFEAPLGQNSFTGGVSNSLSSADSLDGGAGIDTLSAVLVKEFFGSTGTTSIDVQPTIANIEQIEIEVRDFDIGGGASDYDGTVVLDAKNITEVDRIGSNYSDGDLVIENLTTLDNGNIRLTSDMTVTMAYTDNFNTDGDASDLSVYFDEDYLNTSSDASGSQLLIRLVNAVTNVDGGNPIFGTDGFTFSIGDEVITIDLSEIAADATLDSTTAYQAIVDLINSQLAESHPDVTASLNPARPAVFSIDITVDGTAYEPGDDAGTYFPILITNTGSEDLSRGDFLQAQLENETDINSSQSDTPATEAELPISINIELEKVGRDGEGGNLTIGGKNDDGFGDTDVDQNDGIEVFNITVVGDEDKPSNLGQIVSTNNALRTVTIASEARTDASYAALTVRGETAAGGNTTPFGGTLTTLNANAFLGDLAIGTSAARDALNIDTFTATGGGDVTYWAEYTDAGGFPSLSANLFTTTTGAGSDTLAADINDGAQVVMATGTGNDSITASIDGADDSGSDLSTLTVTSTGGDNEVTTTSADSDHEATITLGGGADTVTGNSVNITAETGGGNDAIYAENTGATAVATLAAGTFETAANAVTGDITDAQLLNGREVRVTIAMPEETTALVAEAVDFVNGYELAAFTLETAEILSTERELYEAVADAINSDSMINKLVEADVTSTGNLVITYLVDGSTVAGEQLVEINISEEYAAAADIPAALLTAIQLAENDSTITAANVLTSYQATTTGVGDTYAVTTGTMNVMTFDVTALTTDVGDVITFEVNGETGTVTGAAAAAALGAFNTAGADPGADLAGASVLIGDALYNITSTAANSITLTQVSGSPDVVTALANASVTDDQVAAVTAIALTTTGVLGSNGTDSSSLGDNIVNGGTGDDVIVLSSSTVAAQTDTVVFDTTDIGNDLIVHFDEGSTGDVLDFTAWLDNTVSASGSAESEVREATSFTTTLTNIVANSVVVEDFDRVQVAYGTGAVTFDTITDAQLLAALNGTAAGGNAAIFQHDANANLVGTVGKAILLIQNDDDGDGAVDAGDNFGEYLVVEVTFTDDGITNNVSTLFTDVTIIGTVDFGETVAFNAANFA